MAAGTKDTTQQVIDHVMTQTKAALADGIISPHEWLTPAIAKVVIETLNKHNRPIGRKRVNDLREMMLDGKFPETGENGMAFDRDGILAGGQHTAAAIAGITDPDFKIRLRVTYGVKPSDRTFMNGSMPQRFAHDLSILGLKQAQQLEALERVAILWDRVALTNKGLGGLATYRTANKDNRITLTEEWPKYAEGLVATMSETSRWNSSDVWPGNRGAMQFTWWVLVHKTGAPVETAVEYFDKITRGSSDEAEGNLFLKLRGKLKESDEKHIQVFWLLKVWSLWVKGEYVTKLQAPRGQVDEKRRFTPADPYPRIPKR